MMDKFVLVVSRKFSGREFISEIVCKNLDDVIKKIHSFPDNGKFHFKVRVFYCVDRELCTCYEAQND